jgi:hypothetical protein
LLDDDSLAKLLTLPRQTFRTERKINPNATINIASAGGQTTTIPSSESVLKKSKPKANDETSSMKIRKTGSTQSAFSSSSSSSSVSAVDSDAESESNPTQQPVALAVVSASTPKSDFGPPKSVPRHRQPNATTAESPAASAASSSSTSSTVKQPQASVAHHEVSFVYPRDANITFTVKLPRESRVLNECKGQSATRCACCLASLRGHPVVGCDNLKTCDRWFHSKCQRQALVKKSTGSSRDLREVCAFCVLCLGCGNLWKGGNNFFYCKQCGVEFCKNCRKQPDVCYRCDSS